LAFDTADDEISDSKKDADAVWEILKSDTSRWSSYITTNFPKAHDAFLKAYPKKGFAIEGPRKFDEDFKAVPHVADVYGITEKDKDAITLKEDGVRSSTTRMVFALHELVHWLADPSDQGRHSTSLILLHEGLNEGLTHVVVEDVLDSQQIKRTTLTVYDKRTVVIRAMMKSLGFEPFALTLFKGQYCVLRDAMLNVWNVHAIADLQKLWTFADNNQSDDALKLIKDWDDAAKARGKTAPHATSCKKTP
jgi:hypothetical protein